MFVDKFAVSTTHRYRCAITLAVLFLAVVSGRAEAESSRNAVTSIRFGFRLVTVENKKAFHVEVRFRAANVVNTIIVPTSWGSASNLQRQIKNLKVLTSGATLDDGAKQGEKRLNARPGEQIALAYDIVPLQTEWFRHPQEHMAVISDDYFIFNPQNALVFPDLPGTEVVRAVFDWRALPNGIPLFSSFGIGKRLLDVHAPWYQILDAVFAGGNFRASESHENGTTLVFAARGNWKFTDAQAFTQIRQVIDTENNFWRAAPMQFFLVTLAPFDDKSGDDDGSGFTNAYMLFLSHEDVLDAARIRLLAHEMFHHWCPLSMGPIPHHDAIEWFTEGSTVYYEAAIPLRAGLISYVEYLDYLNQQLSVYQTSPLRHVTNADWQKMSHASGPAYDVPYVRGMAVALWADSTIREGSGGKSSLDNVMHDLLAEAQDAKRPGLSEDRVFAAFGRYLAPEQLLKLRAIVLDGADVPLPEKLSTCAQLVYSPGKQQENIGQYHSLVEGKVGRTCAPF